VSTEAGVCLSAPRPPAMLDPRGLAASTATFLPEDVARAFLEQLRWPGGPVCPHCSSAGAYRLHPRSASVRPARGGVLKCKACRRQFTVTVGTPFESSHLALNKWLLAIAHLCRSDKDLSGATLDRLLAVSPQTVRFVAHRVRQALAASNARMSVKAVRASSEQISMLRAPLEPAGGVRSSFTASGASRPSGKTSSKSRDRGRRSATENGRGLGRVLFEEALASMVNRPSHGVPTDADRHPGGPARPTGEDGRAPGWRSGHDGEIN
jgi:transposase-like protein